MELLAVEAKLEDDGEEEYVDAYAYNEPGSPPGILEIAADAEPPTIMRTDYSYRTHQLQ